MTSLSFYLFSLSILVKGTMSGALLEHSEVIFSSVDAKVALPSLFLINKLFPFFIWKFAVLSKIQISWLDNFSPPFWSFASELVTGTGFLWLNFAKRSSQLTFKQKKYSMQICEQLKCIHPHQPIQHFSEDLKLKEQGFEPEPSCGYHGSLLTFSILSTQVSGHGLSQELECKCNINETKIANNLNKKSLPGTMVIISTLFGKKLLKLSEPTLKPQKAATARDLGCFFPASFWSQATKSGRKVAFYFIFSLFSLFAAKEAAASVTGLEKSSPKKFQNFAQLMS